MLILKGQWGCFWWNLHPWGFPYLLTCHPVLEDRNGESKLVSDWELIVYDETIKGQLNKRLIYECRCDERLKAKSEGLHVSKYNYFYIYIYIYMVLFSFFKFFKKEKKEKNWPESSSKSQVNFFLQKFILYEFFLSQWAVNTSRQQGGELGGGKWTVLPQMSRQSWGNSGRVSRLCCPICMWVPRTVKVSVCFAKCLEKNFFENNKVRSNWRGSYQIKWTSSTFLENRICDDPINMNMMFR